MPIRVADVRAAAAGHRARTQKSDRAILAEAVETDRISFDVFLSHSFQDRELVVGTKKLIEDTGLTVYVDWIDDAALDRSAIDSERADHLRTRMRHCETLFYAPTPNAALKAPDRQVYVLPVEDDKRYEGQEYLSLYETIDLATYRHRPRQQRDQVQFERERLLDALGVRRMPPFGRPFM